MKRYRLVEANTGLYESDAAIEAKTTKSIKRILAPIEDRTFKLDWNKIEDKLGGEVPTNIKVRVERECDGLTFTGFKFFMLMVIFSGMGMGTIIAEGLLWAAVNRNVILGFFIAFCISLAMLAIFAAIHKKHIEKTGVFECIKSAENGEIDSKAVLGAINMAALGIDTPRLNKFLACCVIIIVLALAIYMGMFKRLL